MACGLCWFHSRGPRQPDLWQPNLWRSDPWWPDPRSQIDSGQILSNHIQEAISTRPDPQDQTHKTRPTRSKSARSTVPRLSREVEVDRLGRCGAAWEAKPANEVRDSCELDISKLSQPIVLESRVNKHFYILCRYYLSSCNSL